MRSNIVLLYSFTFIKNPKLSILSKSTRSVEVNRNVVSIFSWLEVGIYHASTEIPPMYLMVLTIRTKYVLNLYVSINIFTSISLRISKLPRIISRAGILIYFLFDHSSWSNKKYDLIFKIYFCFPECDLLL